MPKQKEPKEADVQVIFSNYTSMTGLPKTLVNFVEHDGGVQIVALDRVNADLLWDCLDKYHPQDGLRLVRDPDQD